jgi:hypothetical protein
LTPQTTSAVSGAVLELQGNTIQACDATIDLVSQALQPLTSLPRGVDWSASPVSALKGSTNYFFDALFLFQEELLENCAFCTASTTH